EEDERRHADVVEVREGEVVRRDILVGSGKGGLEGRLTDAGGEPLATRWVSLTGLMEREASPGEFRLPHTTMTDGEGEFAFRDLEPGDYTVEALGTRQKVTVVAAETREITIAVDTARIEGVVVDETGRPVPGAEVALERQGAGPGRRFMLESGEVTDTMGRFVFAKVGPGSYRVSVEEGDSQALSDVFQVDPGGVRKGIRLALEALVTLRVEVTDGTREPVAEAWVFLTDPDSPRRGLPVQTNLQGVAHLKARPGTHELLVMEGRRQARREIRVGRGEGQVFRVCLE
ncbi:MAG: MSCRAMM family protein, partial [Planctomycetota bacterium]